MKNSKIRILKTSVGSVGKVTLIRELQKNGVFVIGTDMNPMSSGLYISDKKYVVPHGANSNFIQSIIDICKIEKPNLILANDEYEAQRLSENKKLFEEMGIILFCSDFDVIKTCFDKNKTKKFLNSINVPTPKIFTSKNAQFPCIIKPSSGSGSEDVYLVHDENELKFYLSKVEKVSSNPIIEEYIKGDEFSVDILSDLNSEPLSIIPRIRIQTESGISTKSIIKNEKTIINFCKKISKELKLKGPSCVQCIKNKSGIKFIEINNRFGGGSILFYLCLQINYKKFNKNSQ